MTPAFTRTKMAVSTDMKQNIRKCNVSFIGVSISDFERRKRRHHDAGKCPGHSGSSHILSITKSDFVKKLSDSEGILQDSPVGWQGQVGASLYGKMQPGQMAQDQLERVGGYELLMRAHLDCRAQIFSLCKNQCFIPGRLGLNLSRVCDPENDVGCGLSRG